MNGNTAKKRGEKNMYRTIGQFNRNRVESSATVTTSTMKNNSLRAATALMAILLVTASAWAGNHQICYQVPPPAGTQRIFVRFACRTDGNPGSCQVQSIQPAFTVITNRPAPIPSRSDGGVEREVEIQGAVNVTATFLFADGSVRKCTVETFTLPVFGQNQDPTVLEFNTDQSGLAMTGIWWAASSATDLANQEVMVPPDLLAVGGGAEGAPDPGTLVMASRTSVGFNMAPASSSTGPRTWLARAQTNVPAGSPLLTAPVTAFGIGLKIEGIPNSTLRTMVQFPEDAGSTGFVPHPSDTLTGTSIGFQLGMTGGVDPTAPPQTVAVISGDVKAVSASSPGGQYVTTTQPVFSWRCYYGGTCEQVVGGWNAMSKDHVNPSPGFVVASVTTLPKVLTINGAKFHVETWVSQATSTVVAHPEITTALPGDFVLTGVGAFVDWQNSPSAAGNMVWRLRPAMNGTDAGSKDQWFSSPAAITAYAIGVKLVPGPVPTVCPPKYTVLFCATH
jgi:hypothetical protein